jgi:hypothetical protein
MDELATIGSYPGMLRSGQKAMIRHYAAAAERFALG